jgi:two-component system OmpR family sensor kinase/two-component system sensor histidine kinase BaeS
MRLRLFLSFSLVILISVVGVVLIARQNAAVAVRSFMLRGGMTGAGGLVETLEDYYHSHGSWQGVEGLVQFTGANRGHGQGPGGMMQGMMMNQRLRLADAEGEILVDSSASQASGEFSTEQKREAIAILVEGRKVGYLLAEGGMGFSERDERFLVDRLTNAAFTAGLIAGGLSLLLSLLLAYSLMRPVRELTRVARQLGEGDLSQRVVVRGHDELALMASTFNSMADSLQESEESRRSMTADIAHELRNPLAVQRANLEALQDGIYPLTPEALMPILDQNLLLTRLVDDLRTLALADAGQLKLERSTVDLVGLAERILERFRSQAGMSQIAISMDGSALSPVFANVDALRIDQIISNLISNALRFTPRGGQVRLKIETKRDQVLVSVFDSGPGIPTEALPYIFERFYRADRSRSRAEGGTGLGLAIAKKLAESHGGALTAANDASGGAVFTLELPI